MLIHNESLNYLFHKSSKAGFIEESDKLKSSLKDIQSFSLNKKVLPIRKTSAKLK